MLRASTHHAGTPGNGAQLAAMQLAGMHRAMRDTFGPLAASGPLAEAGRRAAAGLLRTIPLPEQARRRRLPRAVSTRMLLAALRRWAPRFAATDRRFTASGGSRPVLIIAANPLCDERPRGTRVCAWHEALFETLFQALVSPDARVREVTCLALGDPECRFEVTFDAD